jgi:hypothetical protein
MYQKTTLTEVNTVVVFKSVEVPYFTEDASNDAALLPEEEGPPRCVSPTDRGDDRSLVRVSCEVADTSGD